MEQEKEALGFYLSAHPLDSYDAVFERLRVISSADIVEMVKLTGAVRAQMAGIVSSVRERISQKSGKKFAFVTASDKAGPFDMMCFSDTLLLSKEKLKSGKKKRTSVIDMIKDDNGDVKTNNIGIPFVEESCREDFNREIPETSTSSIPEVNFRKIKFDEEKIWLPWRIIDNNQNIVMEDMAFENEILEIGNKEYKYSSSDAFKEEYKLNYGLEVCQIDNSISDFSDYLYSFYDEPFVCGNNCENANDIMIPEQYLIMFGVPESEYPYCINKNISVKFPTAGNYSLIRNFNICGVIKKECFDGFPVSMIINKQEKYYSEWDNVYVYVKKYEQKNFESIKNTLDDQFGVIGNICKAYEKLHFLQKQSNFVGHILLLVIICVVLAIIFYLVIYMFFYIEQNQKYSAILLSLGLNSKKIALLNMIEVGINSFLATICGIWCSYYMSLKVDRMINEDIGLITWNWNVLINSHLIAVLIFVFLFSIIIGGYTYYKTSHISPSNLFQE